MAWRWKWLSDPFPPWCLTGLQSLAHPVSQPHPLPTYSLPLYRLTLYLQTLCLLRLSSAPSKVTLQDIERPLWLRFLAPNTRHAFVGFRPCGIGMNSRQNLVQS